MAKTHGKAQGACMVQITEILLTDPNDPIFSEPVTVSHPDLQRDSRISNAASQGSSDSEFQRKYREYSERWRKAVLRDSTN